jgi:23S rRNA pseudouridine1911/1915/1917 synthase
MSKLPVIEVKIDSKDSRIRLDQFLSLNYSDYSRSTWNQLIKNGQVLVNGQKSKSSIKLKEGDNISFSLESELADHNFSKSESSFFLDIIYEDSEILVINKPSGLTVHPGFGQHGETLASILIKERKEIYDTFGGDRPGIVHRLDKETSGLMVIAKSKRAFESLKAQILNREIKKEYLAIVFGNLANKAGTINVPIKRQVVDRKKMGVSSSGRESFTEFVVEKEIRNFSLVKAWPLTGRTHQIRVHMAFVGNPVVGDKFYSSRAKQKEAAFLGIKRHMLHASKLGFNHPLNNTFQEFLAPLPDDFVEALAKLKSI